MRLRPELFLLALVKVLRIVALEGSPRRGRGGVVGDGQELAGGRVLEVRMQIFLAVAK